MLTFSLTNPGDLALGKTLYFSFSENEYRSGYATFYMPILERENLEMEDGVTGTRAVTDTSILPAGTKLRAEEVVDDPNSNNDAYDMFHSSLDSITRNMYLYYWSYETPLGAHTINTSEPVTLKFKIPEGWDADHIQLAYWGGNSGLDPTGVSLEEIVGVEDSYYVVKADCIGYFALCELKSTDATGEDLEDGTYTIPVSVYHLTNEGGGRHPWLISVWGMRESS